MWEMGKIRPLKIERDFCVLFRAPLFLGKWCGVATYFLYKKIRKTKYKYMIELFPFIDWIKKIHVWETENYMALGPSYNLPKIRGFLS